MEKEFKYRIRIFSRGFCPRSPVPWGDLKIPEGPEPCPRGFSNSRGARGSGAKSTRQNPNFVYIFLYSNQKTRKWWIIENVLLPFMLVYLKTRDNTCLIKTTYTSYFILYLIATSLSITLHIQRKKLFMKYTAITDNNFNPRDKIQILYIFFCD